MLQVRRQRKRLARWLAEWRLLEALHGEGGAAPRVSGAEGDAARSMIAGPPLWRGIGIKPDVLAGQIRLWAPEAGSVAAARPCYFAVLAVNDVGVLVAPFGRLAEPALPGEWLTGRRRPPMRVLCLWNAERISERGVALSWFVDALKPRELDHALQVLAHAREQAPLSTALARDVGPPLTHPDDPRQIYRFRELARMQHLVRELGARYDLGEPRMDLLKAAEGPEEPMPPADGSREPKSDSDD